MATTLSMQSDLVDPAIFSAPGRGRRLTLEHTGPFEKAFRVLNLIPRRSSQRASSAPRRPSLAASRSVPEACQAAQPACNLVPTGERLGHHSFISTLTRRQAIEKAVPSRRRSSGLDQLTRSKGIQPERARAVKAAIDRADSIRTGTERGAAAVLDQLNAVATQLEGDAGAATGRDAMRLRSLAATIKGRTAKLR